MQKKIETAQVLNSFQGLHHFLLDKLTAKMPRPRNPDVSGGNVRSF